MAAWAPPDDGRDAIAWTMSAQSTYGRRRPGVKRDRRAASTLSGIASQRVPGARLGLAQEGLPLKSAAIEPGFLRPALAKSSAYW
jgi:hypothetical protein